MVNFDRGEKNIENASNIDPCGTDDDDDGDDGAEEVDIVVHLSISWLV